MKWTLPKSNEPMFLIEHHDLRSYYGDMIGQIAASHHWSTEAVAERFRGRRVSCPAFLGPAEWEIDALKLALLLRTADAAHLDDARAPWFLFALRKPQGISARHWHFQAQMGQPKCTARGELKLSSGARFASAERDSWWLAFETAQMVDRELRHAHTILVDEQREPFAAKSVLGIESASAFARHVPVVGWEPIETSAKIGDVNKLISTLGGSALYGDEVAAPLRELLQNASDAVRAAPALGYIEERKGRIKVSIAPAENGWWSLTVADSGVGMSRHVLVNVLLDFGNSLWGSDVVREELPGLAKSNFRAVGKFGIGFFSIFMLGNEVSVRTRRFAPDAHKDLQWHLRFDQGLQSRPALLNPDGAEAMVTPGTIVSVKISDARLRGLLNAATPKDPFSGVFAQHTKTNVLESGGTLLAALVARLCPASSVELTTQFDSQSAVTAVNPDDWMTISAKALCTRTGSSECNLRPVISENGRVIGRVAISNDVFLQGASVTYQGQCSAQIASPIGTSVHQPEAINRSAYLTLSRSPCAGLPSPLRPK